jgi:hypothetical protein
MNYIHTKKKYELRRHKSNTRSQYQIINFLGVNLKIMSNTRQQIALVDGRPLLKHALWYISVPVSRKMQLSIYGSTALVELGRFFSFLICTQLVGLLGRGISPSQGRYLHTEHHKHRINAHRHPGLEWDSNPRP